MSVETETVPHVEQAERLVLDDLGYSDDGIVYLTEHRIVTMGTHIELRPVSGYYLPGLGPAPR